MEFLDFKENPQDLVGKTVLYESGKTYRKHKSLYLVKIVKVTKTGFRLDSMPDFLFSLIDGRQKGLNDRMDIGTISRCSLVTDKEADELRETWGIAKKERALREKMQEKLKTMTLEQLQKMELL